MADAPIRLHLGCGEVYLPGYVNVDYPASEHTVLAGARPDLTVDLTSLSYPPESVREIRLHHVFEHFPRGVALRLLIDWYGWLEDGGELLIETPDFVRSARAFEKSKSGELRGRILRHLFGSHEAAWAVHYDGWYEGKFDEVLSALGYRELTFAHSEWKGTFNVSVTARKRSPFVELSSQLAAATEILRTSLVDDSVSERKLLEVWLRDLTDGHSG